MQILTPHLSVVLTEQEFHDGEGAEYAQKYIVRNDGSFLFRIKTPLGHAQYKIDKLPANATLPNIPQVKLQEEISILPCGKVPVLLYKQIEEFFRRFMSNYADKASIAHSDLEAMAHIVWNPSNPMEYQVRIPRQEVCGASVKYYFDHLEDGDIVVVDIHSHNSMGAFFSGTDNRDDQRNVCYSGVIGQLNQATPATVWRFNDLNRKKIEVKFEEIFKVEEAKVDCPQEWMDKVTKTTFQSYGGGYGGFGAGWGKGNPAGYNGGANGDDLESLWDKMYGTGDDQEDIDVLLAEYIGDPVVSAIVDGVNTMSDWYSLVPRFSAIPGRAAMMLDNYTNKQVTTAKQAALVGTEGRMMLLIPSTNEMVISKALDKVGITDEECLRIYLDTYEESSATNAGGNNIDPLQNLTDLDKTILLKAAEISDRG